MKSKRRLFIADDDDLIVSVLSVLLKSEGYEIHTETKTFKNVADKIGAFMPDVVLLDIKLPAISGLDILQEIKSRGIDTQIIMLTSDDTAETAVKAMKLGAADYLTKPFNNEEVKIVVNNILNKKSLEQEVAYLRKISYQHLEDNIIGESAVIKELKTTIQKMADAHVPSILITGESGTGKELFARYLHGLMYDKYKPFITVNCAALPEHLIESELFGHEKGAFTDAKTERAGVFELASGGSILLDEIGEMRLDLQAKLLRVLEERTVRRIGGEWDMPIDVTVIATTNINLSEVVKTGRFRTDLFFRLSAFPLHIPPLRERRGDIPLLARHLLSYCCVRYNNKIIKGFSPAAEKLMTFYAWPGNVRELKNLVERIVVLENTEEILPEHLPELLTGQPLTTPALPGAGLYILPETGASMKKLEEEFKKDIFMQALQIAEQNKTLAAKLLNISYDSFRYQLKNFGLE